MLTACPEWHSCTSIINSQLLYGCLPWTRKVRSETVAFRKAMIVMIDQVPDILTFRIKFVFGLKQLNNIFLKV